ncbi:MAG: hypothetical protein AAGA68_27415 [Pseudomonadota bacterium]
MSTKPTATFAKALGGPVLVAAAVVTIAGCHDGPNAPTAGGDRPPFDKGASEERRCPLAPVGGGDLPPFRALQFEAWRKGERPVF